MHVLDGKQILYLEGDQVIREHLGVALVAAGAEVTLVESVIEATEAVSKGSFDLIIAQATMKDTGTRQFDHSAGTDFLTDIRSGKIVTSTSVEVPMLMITSLLDKARQQILHELQRGGPSMALEMVISADVFVFAAKTLVSARWAQQS